jgi:acetoin utilization protein AcuB
MLMPSVSQFMTTQPWTIDGGASLTDARDVMHDHKIRHLPVVDGIELVGVVSDRDLRFLEDLAAGLLVRDVMSESPYAVAPTAALDEVVDKMAANTYGSAIVVGAAGVEGIFTANDACRALVEVLHQVT